VDQALLNFIALSCLIMGDFSSDVHSQLHDRFPHVRVPLRFYLVRSLFQAFDCLSRLDLNAEGVAAFISYSMREALSKVRVQSHPTKVQKRFALAGQAEALAYIGLFTEGRAHLLGNVANARLIRARLFPSEVPVTFTLRAVTFAWLRLS
jgi:hypothetical protein